LFANALASRDSVGARVPNVTRSYVGKDVRYGEECDFRYCEGFRMPARDGAATAPELRFGFCLTVVQYQFMNSLSFERLFLTKSRSLQCVI
jgi:hypothetical protein